ncbi:MAG: TolC family protein [Bryobacterales bacterium]|nr:TolC family protein [Bryobacteraceae bacterium]MDW8129713.1 TolC family protein [Bryobacterales bacterium]
MPDATCLEHPGRRAASLVACLIALLGASPAAQAERIKLTLSQAVEMARKNNLQARLAAEHREEADAMKDFARSALLPNLHGSSYQMDLTVNLAAMGFSPKNLPGIPIPLFVGPFNRFDARVQLVQSIFSFTSLKRFQAGRHGAAAAAHAERQALQLVTAATALAYLGVLEAEQNVAAAEADVQLAVRLLELARSRREAGVATGVDVARAETRLAGQRVRLAQARAQLDTARLNLLRTIGADLSSELELSDRLTFTPEALPDVSKAIAQALANRADLKAAREQLRAAEAEYGAALGGWMPSLSFFGDYGSSGLRPNELNLPTRSVGIRIDVPIFNGGRTRAETQLAAARRRQAQARYEDLRAAIEKEVREALDHLAVRTEQVRAAESAFRLAERELELAQDRFRNGLADNVEVVQAQTALENARKDWIASLALYNMARLNLAVATGHAEDFKF